jgi:transcriptional regulator with XRE-family HTH domain
MKNNQTKNTLVKQMTKENLTEIGKRIKAIRTALKIKQKDLAEALDIAGCYLSELESGKANPCHAFFYKLSTRFGVSLDYLFHGDGDMFRAAKTIKEKEKDLEDDKTMNTENLVRLIEISPLFKYQVLGFAAKFRYENDSIIKQDIGNSLAKMSKDS